MVAEGDWLLAWHLSVPQLLQAHPHLQGARSPQWGPLCSRDSVGSVTKRAPVPDCHEMGNAPDSAARLRPASGAGGLSRTTLWVQAHPQAASQQKDTMPPSGDSAEV